jgi:inorganic pyrophosphatase
MLAADPKDGLEVMLIADPRIMTDPPMEAPTHFIGARLTIKIDRPLGSAHPEWGFIYPLNYGYLPWVIAPDGEELDAYLLGVFEPVEEYTGDCFAIIHRLDDPDDKLVIAPEGAAYSDEQIRALTEFQERFFQSEILR